jgi:uncharacterized protein (DUF1501 family)
MKRRYFLKNGGIGLVSLGVMTHTPAFLTRVLAQNKAKGGKKILIAIFQRGALDGLNAVVPYGENEYYKLRPSLAIPRPDSEQGAAIDLDGFFGLHPALSPFKAIYDAKQLAIIHSVGSPNNTRSHFDAQDYMESGTPGVKNTTDGWLNRYLQAKSDKQASPFRAVTLGANLPRTMQGRAPSIAMTSINDFAIRAGGGEIGQAVQGGFEAIYAQTVNESLRSTGKETFDAVKMLKQVNPGQYKPAPGVVYPRGPFGDRLRQIAQLIKSEIGLEVAFTDIGGWDTHANQGASQGQLANRLTDFSQAISALYTDLQEKADDVVLVTMTEFGRTAKENGNRGTDHGHASVMFCLGGKVNGGKIYGEWPGLETEQLYERRDLALTTDFRDVLAELAKSHLGASNLGEIFPGHQTDLSNIKGLIRV